MEARANPDLPCDTLFEEAEWKSVYWILKKVPPDLTMAPTTTQTMLRMIASFGGFLGRKGDKEPGVKSIWIGLQRVHDFACAWEAFTALPKTYG